MACTSCGSGGSCGTGCGSKGCATGGCNKLNTYDWLQNMLQPDQTENQNIYEVRFKTTRKSFYRNVNALDLITGDIVVVESERGYDMGKVSMGGELVRLQMKKRNFQEQQVLKIYRKATPDDIEKLQSVRGKENEVLKQARTIITEMNISMKLTDIEFQADDSKAIFYYTADNRVDFRELIKVFAEQFKIRVEMKQIGSRQEAGLIGGIGACGRELCCSTWLTDFKNVSTGAARYQNLSLNPLKITGMCGRLKCCLNYELETYLDALKEIPKTDRLQTETGIAFLQKTDIFKRKMWFGYGGDSNWICLDVAEVIHIANLNKQGTIPASLHLSDENTKKPEKIDFVDVVGTSTILQNEEKRKKKKKPGTKPSLDAPKQENPVAEKKIFSRFSDHKPKENREILKTQENSPAEEKNEKVNRSNWQNQNHPNPHQKQVPRDSKKFFQDQKQKQDSDQKPKTDSEQNSKQNQNLKQNLNPELKPKEKSIFDRFTREDPDQTKSPKQNHSDAPQDGFKPRKRKRPNRKPTDKTTDTQ